VQNVSIHRCQISSRNRIGVLLLPRHTFSYYRLAEEMGRALEIAIVIGGTSGTVIGVAGDRRAGRRTRWRLPVRCWVRRSTSSNRRTNSVRVPATPKS